MKKISEKLVWFLLIFLGTSIILTSCKKDEDEKSNEAEIKSFVFSELNPVVTATINGTQITATVPFGTDVTALKPTITVSDKAVLAPGTGIANNFTNPVNYIVTAENLATKVTYTVTITQAEPDQPAITEFKVTGAEVVINETEKSIKIKLLDKTDVSALMPEIKIAPTGAVVTPASGVAQNFADTIVYSVSIGDKKTDYNAFVEFIPIGFSTVNQILKLTTSASNPPMITGDNQRGMSMSKDYIFIADKKTNDIHYFDRKGILSDVKVLNKGTQNIIAGGIFLIADVVANGNMVFASNLNGTTTFPANLRIYKWESVDDTEPELFFQYSANVRLGDNFTVTGDLATTGNLWFISNTTGDNKIYRFDVAGGVVTNPTAPVIIALDFTNTVPYARTGNYGSVLPIGSGDTIMYIVNGADMAPALFDKDGKKLTNILTDAIATRTVGIVLFELNNAKYMAYTFTSDAATPAPSKLVILNVTGAKLVDVMNAINKDNVAQYIAHEAEIDAVKNGNVAADVAAYIDNTTGKVYVAGFACNNGVIEVELVK